MAWWLLVYGLVSHLAPQIVTLTLTPPALPAGGWIGHIAAPVLGQFLIPRDRQTYDAFHRATEAHDAATVDMILVTTEWFVVADQQEVRVVEEDGGVDHILMLEGRNIGRSGWLNARYVEP